MTKSLSLYFAPIIPEFWIYTAIGITAALLILSFFVFKRGMITRTLCVAAFLLLLSNPSLVEENRVPVKDIVVIVADQSPSQNSGKRTERTNKALQALQNTIKAMPSLELRTLKAPVQNSKTASETKLFGALDQVLSDVPERRRAGVIFLTDGQIHDIPGSEDKYQSYGPVHALLTGDKDEKDRRIVTVKAPSYGIVGQEVELTYRVEGYVDPSVENDYASVIIRQNNNKPRIELVPINEDQTIKIKIDNAGQNIIDLETEVIEGELTEANNRLPLIVNGVRDRLKVLLVSGQPHAGGRTWRNILTSDPGVDLVHFTILREPNKLDATPQRELSLIAFPFQELFEIKLYDFDLIIFDRYRLNRILPHYYFENIVKYVQEGGALLEVNGPAYAGVNSVYTTALQKILPAFPTGNVIEQQFTPALTETGALHPVTAGLHWPTQDKQDWAPWYRQVAVSKLSGHSLMNGQGQTPLLILDRIGEGRVAQFSSDQIWLWARSYQQGGPQAELLRRLIHWLMKEPQLEENALTATVKDTNITIKRRSLDHEPVDITIKTPNGGTETLALQKNDDGVMERHYNASDLGVHVISDGTQSRFAIVGDPEPKELMNMHTTEEKMKPLAVQSKGGIKWLADINTPRIRLLPAGSHHSGNDWIGLRSNQSYDVTGVKSKPFLPDWLALLFMITVLMGAWWYEGRRAA